MGKFIKAYELSWEAAAFTWQNLWIGLALVFLPCVISVVGAQYFGISQMDHPIAYFILTDLLLPLWLVGWLRYIISQKVPTFKSYRTVDRTFLTVWVYSLVVAAPLYIYEYLNHLVEFNAIQHVIQLKIGVPLQMDASLWESHGAGFITLIIIAILSSPLFFLFPALADKKTIPLTQIWKRVKPFYSTYVVSYGILLLIVHAMSTAVLRAVDLLDWYLASMGTIYSIEFAASHPLWSIFLGKGGFVVVLLQYVAGLYLFALVGLYYKKYLYKKKHKAPKEESETAVAPAPVQPATNPY